MCLTPIPMTQDGTKENNLTVWSKEPGTSWASGGDGA